MSLLRVVETMGKSSCLKPTQAQSFIRSMLTNQRLSQSVEVYSSATTVSIFSLALQTVLLKSGIWPARSNLEISGPLWRPQALSNSATLP